MHCTAGIGRAPQTSILFMCLYKGYNLDYAIDFVKKKRIISKPNRSLNLLIFKITFIFFFVVKELLEDILKLCPKDSLFMANGNGKNC